MLAVCGTPLPLTQTRIHKRTQPIQIAKRTEDAENVATRLAQLSGVHPLQEAVDAADVAKAEAHLAQGVHVDVRVYF